jgi:hypothetical protein
MEQAEDRAQSRIRRRACVITAFMVTAIASMGLAAGESEEIIPCPGVLPIGPVVIPPRVGLHGGATSDSRDAAMFPAPIGPGQTLTLRIHLNAQFIGPSTTWPSVEYHLYYVRGTQPSNALALCDSPPLLSGTVRADTNTSFTTKSVDVEYVLSAPNPDDDPYPVLDFLVVTHGNTLVDWSITPEPCGYACLEPILFPGPCDPVTDPWTCS